MPHVVIIGAGTGGVPAAYEIRAALGADHRVTLINASSRFQFVPSNPWVAVGWREPEQISLELQPYLAKHNIAFIPQKVEAIDAEAKRLRLADGASVDYDFLVITTGPKLAFEEIPGFGRDEALTQSICTLDHAIAARQRYEAFLEDPGPIVVGAVQGASCFGPAYEFALILDADLRKRKLRNKVPMTFVTSEP
jgi:sulfide:quinone oxidoreductase